jgi:hypothetical protein
MGRFDWYLDGLTDYGDPPYLDRISPRAMEGGNFGNFGSAGAEDGRGEAASSNCEQECAKRPRSQGHEWQEQLP